MSDEDRKPDADPRRRPPDPAGTRPSYDPATLLPPAREPFAGPWYTSTPPAPAAEPVPAAAPDGGAPGGRAPATARSDSRFAPRFQFVLGALLAVGAAAVAVAVLVFSHQDDSTGAAAGAQQSLPRWSAWTPSHTVTDDAPTQIAKHVMAEYRYEDGNQMLAITGSLLSYQVGNLALPVSVAFRAGTAIQLVADPGITYNLCGLGDGCSILHGQPTQQRFDLVRRAALELALYTFEYLPAAGQVDVQIPPSKQDLKATRVVYFRRADLINELAHPLTDTLTPRIVTPADAETMPDALRVAQLTSVFNFQYRVQDQTALMVLDPVK